jgi:hypothetical protein
MHGADRPQRLAGTAGWNCQDSPYGGNRWALIAGATLRLRDALLERDETAARQLITEIRYMSHNTPPGRVGDKLAGLDAALR